MSPLRVRRRVALVLAYGLLAAVACDDPVSPEESGVDRVEVAPSVLQLTVGDSRSASARVVGAGGNTLGDKRVFWATQNPLIATVSQAGNIVAVATGTTQIAASAGGKSGVVQLSVVGRPVSQVRMVPTTATVQVQATVTLRAEGLDATGGVVAGRPVIWASSNNAVATVSSTGQVTGITPGPVTITATVDGISGSAVVTVVAIPVATVTVTPTTGSLLVGQSLQLSATTVSAAGQTLNGRVITWTSTNNTVATVSSTGLVSAIAPGTANVTATSEGRSASSVITVQAVPVASVSITPNGGTLAAGQTLQLTAQALDANNQVLNRTIQWSSDAPAVATVSASGLVTAINAGAARISASVGSVVATATITVTPVPVATLTISPNGTTIQVGQSAQLAATARAADGTVLPNRPVTWISGSPSVATVGRSDGLVTAVGPGTVEIFATTEQIVAQVTVTVSNVGVATVRVTPATGAMQQGQSLQLTATALDANNNVISGRTVAWSSSNEAVATVSSTGRVLGVSIGQVTITATIDGIKGTGIYSVGQVPLGSITIVPSAVSMAPGGTATLIVQLTDINGTPISPTGRTVVWSSSNTSVATVNQSGVVTGVGAGSATITASSEGISDQATVTVSTVPIATITVTPNPATIVEGNSPPFALTGTARDASGNVLTGRTFTWTEPTANPFVSVNSSTGAVTVLIGGGGTSATIQAAAPGAGAGGSNPPPGTTTVNVSWSPVATANSTPNTATLSVGATLPLSLTIRNAASQVLPTAGRTITWSSNDVTRATVNSAGVVTGVGSGVVKIAVSALSPGQLASTAAVDTATITVQNVAPVDNVTLAISPDSTILPGAPLTGTATVRDAANNLLQGRVITLTSSNTGFATVAPASGTSNASGQIAVTVTGVAGGNATITASSEGKNATFLARILNPVNSVVVAANPDSVIGTGGPTVPATATLLDVNSAVLTGRPTTWQSTNTAVATVSGAGVITSVGQGTTSIQATSEGKTGSRTFRVLAPVASIALTTPGDSLFDNTTLAATATLRDAANVVLTGRPITWTSSNTSVATVNGSGLMTGVAAGTASITASAEGVSSNVPIRVLPGIVAIGLTPATDSLIGMGTVALTARATASGGAGVQGRPLTITSSNVAAATVTPASGITNASGDVPLTVTYVAPGNTTVTVTGGGQNTARVMRMLAPVATVSLTAAGDSILGTGQLLTAVQLRDASTNLLTGRPVTYASSNPAVATVSAVGVVTGVAPGTVNITASSEGQTSPNLALRVLPGVNTVNVTAPNTTLLVTQTSQAVVALFDVSNNPITGRPITWSTSSVTKATVSATGLVTALDSGSVTITATVAAEGKSGTLGYTLNLVPAATVQVSPSPASLTHEGSPNQQQFIATARDSAGNVLSGRAFTWSSSNAGKLTMSPTGIGTTVDSGTVTVTAATSPGTPMSPVSGAATATITLAPVNQVTITPPSVTVAIGATSAAIEAHATVASGGNATARACTLVSGNTALATVAPASGTTDGAGKLSFTVTGVASTGAGTVAVVVTCEGKQGTLTVTVP